MIDTVYGGEYLAVSSSRGATPYINTYQNQPMIGAVSYDNSSQTMKVYDGSSWQNLGGGSASINLTGNAIATLKWAEKKMHQEAELKRLAEENPTIKDLVNAMQASVADYEHKIAMVKSLIQKEETIGTS